MTLTETITVTVTESLTNL